MRPEPKGQRLIPVMDDGKQIDGLFFDPQSGVIYFLKSINGRKVKFSTFVKMPLVLKAKREANRLLQEKLGKKKTRSAPLIKDETDAWILVKESEGLKPLTLKNVKNARKRIDGFWGQMFPNEITRDNLVKWYAWLAKTYPGEQRENAIKYMRNFCRYLAEKQHNGVPLLPAVPTISDPDYKRVRAERKKRKEQIFTPAEFTAVYRAGNDVEKLIALLMYTMAMRIDETLNLRVGEQLLFFLETPIYRWEMGQNKADLWGRHALHTEVVRFMQKKMIDILPVGMLVFRQKHNPEKALRPQMIDWDDWRKRAGLGWHWTSHTFRHTCLSNLFNDEKNPQALICKLYRVSLAVAMETYIKPTPSGIMKMRDAIEVKL